MLELSKLELRVGRLELGRTLVEVVVVELAERKRGLKRILVEVAEHTRELERTLVAVVEVERREERMLVEVEVEEVKVNKLVRMPALVEVVEVRYK